jgi:hypothetical protein
MDAKQVARGIKERDKMLVESGVVQTRVWPGVADASIDDSDNGPTVRSDMMKERVEWTLADKSPGSRKQGWLVVRRMLRAVLNQDDHGRPRSSPREEPGMFFVRNCTSAIELLPSMPRDDKNLDDIDTDAEDHLADEVRYRARNVVRRARQRDM